MVDSYNQVSPSKVISMGTGIRSNPTEGSDGNEKMEILHAPTPPQQEDGDQHEESPSRQSTPGPEKKPSKQSLLDTMKENDDGHEAQDQANSENDIGTPSNGLDWEMEQYGHRRNWLNEVMDAFNQLRFNCGMFINNGHIQFFIIVLISINAIMMGVGTFDFVKKDPQVDLVFEQIDKAFLITFTVELILQFIYHGWRLFLDGWLCFDFIIIVTSWTFSSVQIIRAFRIFRALRLVTRIKIMKNLIIALFGVMPRMAAIGLMLLLIFYIFAVMFTQLFKDLETTDYPYFSQMGATLFTLFQMMTLDNWASIARQVIAVYSWAWAPFIAFVVISGFIIVNLIIAVICDAISALHNDEKTKIYGDDDETDTDHSQQMEIREQLDCLEEQMEELTRIQARTFHTLQYLTRQMQMNKLKKELQGKNDFASAASNLKSTGKSTGKSS